MPNPSALEHAAADSGAPLSSSILDVSTSCGALQSDWFSLGELSLSAYPGKPRPAHPVDGLRRPGRDVA